MDRKYSHRDIITRNIKSGNLDSIKKILEINPVPINDGYLDNEFLIDAIKEKQIDIVKYFLTKTNFRVYNSKHRYNSWESLDSALDVDNLEVFELLFKKGSTAEKKHPHFKQFLYQVILKKKQDILQLIVSHLDIQVLNEHDLIHQAVSRNDMDALKILLDKGLIITKKNEKNETPFCLAKWNVSISNALLAAVDFSKIDLENYDDIALFYIASMNGNLTVLKKFLDIGFPIDAVLKSESNELSILKGCKFTDDLRSFDRMQGKTVKSKSHEWSILRGFNGYTALHFAIRYSRLEMIEFLLKNGADCTKQQGQVAPTLHLLIEISSLKKKEEAQDQFSDIIRLLLKYGASKCIDSHSNTALHYAFLEKRYSLLEWFLNDTTIKESNSTNDMGLSHFHIACTVKHSLIENFLEKGVDVDERVFVNPKIDYKNFNKAIKYIEWHGCSPLHFAVTFHVEDNVQLLLSNNANARAVDARGYTPLHRACQYSEYKFCQCIEEGVEEIRLSECWDSYNNYLAEPESDEYNEESFDDVVNDDLYPDYAVRNKVYEKVIFIDDRYEQVEIVNLLLKVGDINSLDSFGNSPLFYAYDIETYKITEKVNNLPTGRIRDNIIKKLEEDLRYRRKEILDAIEEHNPNIQKCYENGSILNFLVQRIFDKEHVEIIKHYLQNGADPNTINSAGWSILHESIKYKSLKVCQILLEYKANVNYAEPSKLDTPLHYACKSYMNEETEKIVELLLNHGADVDAKNIDGMTPLHCLVSKYGILSYDPTRLALFNLLRHGANIDSKDAKEQTPLYKATTQSAEKILVDLLKSGANINIQDADGNNVFSYMYDKELKNCTDMKHMGLYSFETLKVLVQHYLKIQVIGLPLNEKLKSSFSRLFKKCKSISAYVEDKRYDDCYDDCNDDFDDFDDDLDDFDGDERESITERHIDDDDAYVFVETFKREKKKLQDLTIDEHTSLYEVIFKTDAEMFKIVKNPVFQEILESKVRNSSDYTCYGYLLELQNNKGILRCKLIELASESLKFLVVLPDLCSELILSHFTNNEMRDFINTIYLLDKEEKDMLSKMSQEISKIDTFFNYQYTCSEKRG